MSTAWYYSNREYHIERVRQNRQRRLGHYKSVERVCRANNRARKRGLVATLTLEEWLDVVAAHDGRCAYCFAPYEQLDHIQSLDDGGGTAKGNVVPACSECNTRKSKRRSAGKNQTWVPSVASRFWPSLPEEMYA